MRQTPGFGVLAAGNTSEEVSEFPDMRHNGGSEYITHEIYELYNQKRYVPVAFCLQTETEYHDMFREILISLFESIRVPKQVHKT